MVSQSFFFLAVILATCTLSFATSDPRQDAAPSLNNSKSSDSIPQTSRAVDLSVSIDVLGIANNISNAISTAQNREAFVKNLTSVAFYQASSRYNVMVFNLGQAHRDHLQGVKLYASANYVDIVYGIWVFESGTFYNDGDGGFINWAFIGRFNRDGGSVYFRDTFYGTLESFFL